MINTLITTLEYIAQLALFAPLGLFLYVLVNLIRGEGDDDSALILVILIIAMFVEYIGLNMWQELAL